MQAADAGNRFDVLHQQMARYAASASLRDLDETILIGPGAELGLTSVEQKPMGLHRCKSGFTSGQLWVRVYKAIVYNWWLSR